MKKKGDAGYSVKPQDKVAESDVEEKKEEQSMFDCSIVETLRPKPI